MRRYPKTPWLYPATDLVPQGDPETVVFLPRGGGTLVGLHIKGVPDMTMLGIREDEAGQPLSCAITNEVHIDTHRHAPVQMNPRRPETADDGA